MTPGGRDRDRQPGNAPGISGLGTPSGRPRAGRPRRRVVAIAVAAVVLLVLAGIGTASAATHGHWWSAGGHHGHPGRPSASPSMASPSPGHGELSPGPSATTARPSSSAGTGAHPAPPPNAGFDYQIGGAYPPPSGVGVISRDRSDRPVAGKYNICYLNGFQAQTEETGWWQRTHNDLLLKGGGGGAYVMDTGWDEALLDISTPAKRTALAAIVNGWIDGCATAGYQAVEIDNLDSWTRSNGLLSQANAVAYAQLLVAHAHQRGLAAGQKNTVELSRIGRSTIGFDFAIAEECADFTISAGTPECQGYVDVYGANVIVIEYDATHFRQACSRYGARLSIVERDRDVTTPGSGSYVYQSC